MEGHATLRPSEDTEYWTPKETASYLGISRRMLASLTIKHIRYTRKTILYLARDVREFRENARREEAPG